jgi:molybdenum cofactor synthesis domain-containing protein
MARSALVVIGNEILSGKIVDTNTPFLIAELRSLGVELAEIAVVPDEVARIAEAVARVASRSEHVFTSGGVGPTHDDVTMEGVAAAFAVPVIRHPRLEALLRGYYDAQKLPLEEANLRMADVPEGATLLEGPDLRWPVVAMRNVYVLPGIPEIFRRKFLAIRERFRDTPFVLRRIYVRCEEGPIAKDLSVVAARFPQVAIGSYPRMQPDEDGHRVLLTLEGKEESAVAAAVDDLVQRIASHVSRTT